MRPTFHYLVRAILTSKGHALLVRKRGENYTFLPGGHIEVGESAPAALRREFMEETGLNVEVGAFLGAVENSWDDGQPQTEINLVFAAALMGVDAGVPVVSLEDHLEFFWVPIPDVAMWNLLPEPMRDLVATPPPAAYWASTMASR